VTPIASLDLDLFLLFHTFTPLPHLSLTPNMPALTEKVFLPISIFYLNILFAIFRFVLISAVGAIFAIYAKYGGEYAKSVGWIRRAGYREMIKTFMSAIRHKNAPGSVMAALVAGFFVTLVASFLDKGIASFITPAFKPGPPTRETVVSSQFQPRSIYAMFFGWSFLVPSGDDVVGTMKKALNSSIAISEPEEGMIYSPVISGYSTTCTDFGVILEEEGIRNGSGCAWIRVSFTSNLKAGRSIKTERSPNRWSIVMASDPEEANYTTTNLPVLAAHSFEDPYSPSSDPDSVCRFLEDDRSIYPGVISDGVTTYPRTSTTKCFHDDANITVAAMTTTRIVGKMAAFDSMIAEFYSTYNKDDLLSTMTESIRTTRIPSLPGQPSQNITAQMWAELWVTDSTIDIFVCAKGGQSSETFECVYITITMYRFNQTISNATLQAIKSKRYGDSNHSAYMILEYAPDITGNNTVAPISTEKIRKDNIAVADYMARLGSNYYADFDEGNLYIEYDKAKLEFGLDVPLWVLLAAGFITLVSFCVWQLTYWLVGLPHISSLYTIIRTQMGSMSTTPIPRLMRFRYQPLMFEDTRILPDQVEHLSSEAQLLDEGYVRSIEPEETEK